MLRLWWQWGLSLTQGAVLIDILPGRPTVVAAVGARVYTGISHNEPHVRNIEYIYRLETEGIGEPWVGGRREKHRVEGSTEAWKAVVDTIGVMRTERAVMRDALKEMREEMKEMREDRRLRETEGRDRVRAREEAPTREPSALTVRDSVKELPSYTEGGDLAKFIRGIEAELKELKLDKAQWRGILLVKLLAKIKDNIIEYIEDGASYHETVQGLLAKVGKSMVELESEFFPPGRRSSKDRVERVKELIAWGKRVLMLCPNDQKLLLFLVRGALFSELSSHECGLLRGQSTRTVEDLTEAVRAMRDNSTARGREEPRFSRGNNYSYSGGYSGTLKCYVCNKSSHKAYTCPERGKQASHNNNKRDNSKHSNERENKDSRPKRTKLAQSR